MALKRTHHRGTERHRAGTESLIQVQSAIGVKKAVNYPALKGRRLAAVIAHAALSTGVDVWTIDTPLALRFRAALKSVFAV